MADLVELFDWAVARFGSRIAAIHDHWAAATPDTEWDVRALVNHVLTENLWAPPLLSGNTISQVGDRFDGDQLGGDPEAAWAAAVGLSIPAVSEMGALERTVHVSFGDISGREYVSQLICDHVIHGWDLDRAIGTDELIDTELVDFAYEFLVPQVEGWRAAGAFGPQVEVPAGAGRQAELLALTGRNPFR
ncbi:MAG TPA: TIGR03086 family metal-binding protein [Acidimicrobiales bacterium]|jgi:uncharacterized protein (TIGR03086 family)